MTFNFRICNNIPWVELASCYDATLSKSEHWASFLERSQNVHPFVVEVLEEKNLIGWFYGQKIKKFGVSMVVSPFEGWTTSYQGLSMKEIISGEKRVSIYLQLVAYLFENNYCLYFQASDWQLEIEDVKGKFFYNELIGYKLDLTQDFETVIYKKFKEKSAKYSIKKARKYGIIIQQQFDRYLFSENYYKQLLDVFGKQGLMPTYDKQRIIYLCESLELGNELLLFEAYLPDGVTCVATGLFICNQNLAIYYGAASYGEYQKMCPNELLMYEAIKQMSELGIREMEFGGGRTYKEKYGPISFVKPCIVAAKYPLFISAKNLAKKSYYGLRTFMAKLKVHNK